ncbi:MAG: alpha/beta fold hydrolase, partial [Bacteroidota bacterium]
MKRHMYGILLFLIIGLALFGLLLALMHYNQEKLIFHPEKLPSEYQYRMPGNFEEINFHPQKNITLNALHFRVEKPRGVVLYFHGNAGSLASWGEVAEQFTNRGYNAVFYDYRTYGKSNGRIVRERDFHRDAEFIYQELRKEYAAEDIVFYGRSLGTGIAARLAVRHTPKFLVLETPYYNFIDVSTYHYSFVPAGRLLRYKFFTNRAIPKTECPIYLIHGTKDQVVPYNSSPRLEALNPQCEL